MSSLNSHDNKQPHCEWSRSQQVTKALDALLVGLSDVAKKASEELGRNATEAQIVDRTIKLCPG